MALVVNDRVKETTTTTGTGTVTLGGAVSGFDTFAAGIGNSNTTYYCIQLGAEFEVGLGTLAGDSSTLARTTVISSSNSDNAVNFSAGAKNVFCTLPASKATVLDASGNLTLAGAIDVDGVTNLDVVDIDGAVQLDATFTVGANDQGYDVTLHGDTASRNVVWDSSADSLIFTDNAKALFGDGSDLQIFHDGSNSYIVDSATGNLAIQSSGAEIQLSKGPSGFEHMIRAIVDGAVELYHDGTKKLETTAAGVEVTGTITPSGVITANAGVVVDEITIDGDTITATDDFIIDAADDITLDADGADILFKDAGTLIGKIANNDNSNFRMDCSVQDKDFILGGNDGGTIISAMVLDMSAAGAATFNNDVTAFSDERLKRDIETIPNALDKVCQMRGVTFERIDDEGHKSMGVIAQEVEKIIPEVVREDKSEEKIKSVAYGNMVGVLIEAIKELKAEVEELKSQLPHEHNEGIFKDLDKINRS